ncbi:MAG: hypothetical protein RIQ81_361 [Pseudomonadota bacterium]|jgi:16S rRNA (guanine966-N2)-methyltransferase
MKLKTPPGSGTRPTLAKTRAAVINSVQGLLEGARTCDLFAGSGAVGIEAISRGAASCVFVEKDPSALSALTANLAECQRRCATQGLNVPPMPVVRGDVMQYLQRSLHDLQQGSNSQNDSLFDLIWVDPPYAMVAAILPDLLKFAEECLAERGLVLLESGSSQADALNFPEHSGLAGLTLKSEKKYGGTFITTWQKK